MNPQAEELNKIIRAKNPVVFELLSERGKNIFFPKKGILGQTADAKGTKINATIGTAVEDDNTPMRLEAIASKIALDPAKVFPYAPSFGRPDLRAKWKTMLYEKNPSMKGKEVSLPVVTNALTHGASMAGYLFLNEGEEAIVSDLFWGNYNLILNHAYGSKIGMFNLFKNGGFDLDAFENKLNNGGVGKKVVILNFPNNPSGYSPTIDEYNGIVSVIKKSADAGNKIVVITDDAYFGLVYEQNVAEESVFAALADLHENVLAVKIDGPTKEDYVWGFRVGFITFAVKGGDAELYGAIEAKAAGAVRGNISNAANLSQSLLIEAYEDENYESQKKAKFELMKVRYDEVKNVLHNEAYKTYFEALPFNSGYFMCVKLVEGIDGEALRKLLIEKYSIGIINLNNIIRVAFSAVAAADIKELFDGIYKACAELKN
ncbi:MAG: aminotransferase class I/II-fold pyridoxal phosphate-dependent enzyme [Prolixibacteraceae bacterium]|jgi:aspartate/methionine/tyrosine aminotransferase|nr:aminotransferase class I/II-fold pyridoxal phosphate-dependent enzyme [Prolixibacteraceae bacterium]